MSTQRNLLDGNTPLHNAIAENVYQDVLYLLNQPSTSLNERNTLGETPLFYSIKLCRSNKLIGALIEYGCDVNISNKHSETPLHLAAQRHQDLITYKLIRYGADVHAKDKHGSTPLHRAAAKRRDDNIHVLLYFGSSVDEKNSSGMTPFGMVFRNSKYTMNTTSPCLLNYVVDFNERDSDGFTHLHRALEHQSYAALDMINRGADVNMTVQGKHCIHYSLLYDYSDVFLAIWHRVNPRLLLKLGYYYKKCFLEMFLNDKWFNDDEYLKCLYLIFDSLEINAFVHQYLQNEKKADRAMHVALEIYIDSLQERLNLIYLFLSSGFEIYFEDICTLYDKYLNKGCYLEESIEIVLNHGSRIFQNESISNAEHYDNICVYLIMCRICYNNFDIYLNVPDDNLSVYYYEIRRYQTLYKANFEMDHIPRLANFNKPNRFYIVTEVPSLLQLSRDAFRAAVYDTFSTEHSFKVYQVFSRLPVPELIKDILRLKTPIYTLDNDELDEDLIS